MTVAGFTGTREGLSNAQLGWLHATLETAPPDGRYVVHHGACVGADEAVHAAALDAQQEIHVWPPVNPKYLATQCVVPRHGVTVHHAMPYLNRNREIARAAEGLIAFPKQDEQPDAMLWGGTWYTVNFAQRILRPVVICYPNGRIEIRKPEGTQQ